MIRPTDYYERYKTLTALADALMLGRLSDNKPLGFHQQARLGARINELIKSGNTLAMREALMKTLDKLQEITVAEEYDAFLMDDCVRYIKAALDEPQRNCDVGTAKEQEVRFTKVCTANSKDGVRGLCSETCPFSRDYQSECALAWAQMPYQKGGAV